MSTIAIWRLPEVLRQTGLSRSTIYEMISRGDLPRRVQLGRRAVGWMAEDVLAWIHAKIESGLADSPTTTA
jgi:prophage regulatory protein